MARLPQPGSDDGQWGTILNTYLQVSHNTDGTIKDGTVGSAKLAAGAPANGQVLGYNGTSLAWTTPATGGSVSPATTTALGTVQLAGHLGGTAASPTVPGLAGKADNATVVHTTGNEDVAGVKDFTSGLKVNGADVVVTNDARLTNTRVPSDGSVTVNKLSAGSGVNGQVLSYDSGNLIWTTATANGTVPDAAPGTKGLIALSGDLAGTAGTPTAPGLAAKANDNVVVHLATAENITGVKTFSVSPIVPTPTTPTQAATKAYVDATAGAGGAVTSVAGKTGVVTLAKADVGLSNVDNTTDAAKPVSTATQTLLNGKAASTHVHSAADVTTGTVAAARLGSGTANNTTYLRGDGQWATPAGGGGGGNGYAFTLRNVTDQSAITAAAFDVIMVRSVANSKLSVTLPNPTLNSTVRVKRMAPTGNSVEVGAPSGSFIDAASGVGTHMLNSQFDSQDFWSDGLNWYRV